MFPDANDSRASYLQPAVSAALMAFNVVSELVIPPFRV